MPTSRALLLDRLESQPDPVTVETLVRATGLHGNTVREHLAALLKAGLATRHQAPIRGRGRPAWLYEAAAPRIAATAHPDYAGLASALAAHIDRTSASPREDAETAGRLWGHDLAVAQETSDGDARARVVDLLDDLGFAPEPAAGESTTVRLTRCPLLEAAHRHPEVVCGVHLGLARGALEAHGGDPDGTDLVPFAEPGACLLLLGPQDTP